MLFSSSFSPSPRRIVNRMLKVLVVEDDKYLNKLLSDHLLNMEMEIVSSLDGQDAWNKLQEAQAVGKGFQLIVLDMLLPRLMGAELLTKINNQSEFDGLRRIAISGVYKSEDDINQIKMLHRVEAYLTKPFDLEHLSSTILQKEIDTSPNQSFKNGYLNEFNIERVFYRIYSQGLTGCLRLIYEEQHRRVFFLNGHPISADSSSVGENFGESLVKLAFITKEKREEASREMVKAGLHFGEMLVRMKAISKDDLFRALRKHTYQLLVNVFLTRQGRFEFENLHEIPAHLPRIEFNPFLLMLSAQEKLISVEALASLANIHMDAFPVRQSRYLQLLPLLRLETPALEALKGFHSKTSLRSLLKGLASNQRMAILRVLYLFEDISLVGWSSEPTKEKEAVASNEVDFSEIFEEGKQAGLKASEDQIFSRYMDTLNQDFFQILNVEAEASNKEIDAAYREARARFHPDSFEGGGSGQSRRILDDILERLDRAYTTLSEPSSRKEYAQTLKRLSADSAADSKRYLQAQDFFREAVKLLSAEKFAEAKQGFEKAFLTWRAGIEYRLYAEYCQLRIKLGENSPQFDIQKNLHKYKEMASNYRQSEVGFLLAGHLYRVAENYEEARSCYTKALELNSQSADVQNALTSLARESGSKIEWRKKFSVAKPYLKKAAVYIVLLGSTIGLISQKNQFMKPDLTVREIDAKDYQSILPILNIRKKEDMAKLELEGDALKDIPDPVFRSKCLQILAQIESSGVNRLYFIERGKGLKGFCSHEQSKRY